MSPVDLRPALLAHRERSLSRHDTAEHDWDHFNADGHALVARELAPVVARKLWPGRE